MSSNLRIRTMASAVAIALLALATGCSTDLRSFAQKYVRDEELEFCVEYLELMQAGEVEAAYDLLVPQLQDPQSRAQLEGAGPILAAASLDSRELVGVNVRDLSDRRHVNLTWEIPAGVRYVITNVAIREVDGRVGVEGFSSRLSAESLRAVNAFTLEDRSAAHFVWLALAVLIPLFVVGVVVLLARSKGMPRRWVWMLVALIAAPVFALNWTTGDWQIRLMSFVLLGGGIVRSGPMAPWVLSFAIPCGALVALWRRSVWRRRLEARPPSPLLFAEPPDPDGPSSSAPPR